MLASWIALEQVGCVGGVGAGEPFGDLWSGRAMERAVGERAVGERAVGERAVGGSCRREL